MSATEQLPAPEAGPPAVEFFGPAGLVTRTIPLLSKADPAELAELALEASSPFPAEQLYHGWLADEAGAALTVFAAHHRLADLSGRVGPLAVLPATVALLGQAPDRPCLRLWRQENLVVAAAWGKAGRLPECWITRRVRPGEEVRERLVAEAAARTGRPGLALEEYEGDLRAELEKGGQGVRIGLKPKEGGAVLTTRLTRREMARLDLRDKSLLQERARARRIDRYFLAAALAGCGVLLAALLGEAAMRGLRARMEARQAEVAARAPEVRRIETTRQLAARIEQLATRRLRPLELLGIVNDVRPAAIEFTRCEAADFDRLSITAMARDTASISAYETALRQQPAIATVNLKIGTLRDGIASFELEVIFKPAAFGAGGGGT